MSRITQSGSAVHTQNVVNEWLRAIAADGYVNIVDQTGESRTTALIKLAVTLGFTSPESLPENPIQAYAEAHNYLHTLLPAGYWLGETEAAMYIYQVAFLPLPV